MIAVACLWTGDKYPVEYVTKLFHGVRRHTTRHDWGFEVHSKAEYPGWWQKLMLFPPRTRTIFLDLDVVITGNVDFLFNYDGPFCIWKDPWASGYNSSVMSIAPYYGAEIRGEFTGASTYYMAHLHGDQDFLNRVVKDADLWPQGKIKSYKADNLEAGPGDASICVFHGEPKPHQLGGWVKDAWI